MCKFTFESIELTHKLRKESKLLKDSNDKRRKIFYS